MCLLADDMKPLFPLPLAILLLLVEPTSLHAQEPASPTSRQPSATDPRAAHTRNLLDRYDANGNGKLDPEEVEAVARDRFLKWDADGSGKVDQAEMKKLRAQTVRGPKQDKAIRAANLARALESARIQAEREKRLRASGKGPAGGAKAKEARD